MTKREIKELRKEQICIPMGKWMRCNFIIRYDQRVDPSAMKDYVWFPITGGKKKAEEENKKKVREIQLGSKDSRTS